MIVARPASARTVVPASGTGPTSRPAIEPASTPEVAPASTPVVPASVPGITALKPLKLSALVGEPFVAHLATTHAAYGEALGITSAQEPYMRLRSALSIYLGVVVSGVRNEEITLAQALVALEPVARMKAEAKARGSAEPAVAPEPMPAI